MPNTVVPLAIILHLRERLVSGSENSVVFRLEPSVRQTPTLRISLVIFYVLFHAIIGVSAE